MNPRVKRILIINPFGIGDVLFTIPLIRNIRLHAPDAFIGFILNSRTAPLLRGNPLINKIHVYERDEYLRAYKQSKADFLKMVFRTLKDIRREHYDVVLDLSANSVASFLMLLIGIPLRIGYRYKNRSRFLTHPVLLEGFEGRHVIDYHLDLLKFLDVPVTDKTLEIQISPEDIQWAKNIIRQNMGPAAGTCVALVPGGGASWGAEAVIKRWPTEKFAQVADKIVENFSAPIILLGDENEKSLTAKIAGTMRHKALDLGGKTDLGQMAAVLSCCALVILNDSGPLHLAVAVGASTVSIFGPVDEVVYGPFPPARHRVVTAPVACRPCYRRFRRARCEHISCIRGIEVEDVYRAAEQTLKALAMSSQEKSLRAPTGASKVPGKTEH